MFRLFSQLETPFCSWIFECHDLHFDIYLIYKYIYIYIILYTQYLYIYIHTYRYYTTIVHAD